MSKITEMSLEELNKMIADTEKSNEDAIKALRNEQKGKLKKLRSQRDKKIKAEKHKLIMDIGQYVINLFPDNKTFEDFKDDIDYLYNIALSEKAQGRLRKKEHIKDMPEQGSPSVPEQIS